MRNALLTLLFAILGALGLSAIPTSAHAHDDARVYVDLGDVGISLGRPYYRHDRAPLFVAYDRYHQPRYYRHAPRRVYPSNYYDPYFGDRVIVRPRVVERDSDYGYGYRDHHYRNEHFRGGYRDRYWVDRYGRRHYYRH